MPTQGYIRMKLIRIVEQEAPIIRRSLVKRFAARSQADYQIGELISDGVFITTGIGRRGMPEKIQLSPVFPKRRCPYCLQDTLPNAKVDPLYLLP